jgi:uncharacterized phage protein (TIGR01671 family)
VYTGEWVYGGIRYCHNDISFICEGEGYEEIRVKTNTVGEYTGLKDRNGVKIFEGDIVRLKHYDEPPYQNVLYENVVVVWDEFECAWSIKREDKIVKEWPVFAYFLDCVYGEVIGNIHDNPELLEAK